MRAAMLVAVVLATTSSLAAQTRDTVIERRGTEAVRTGRGGVVELRRSTEARAEARALELEERALEATQRNLLRLDELRPAIAAEGRALQLREGELRRVRPALEAQTRDLQLMERELAAAGTMRLREVRPSLNATGRRLDEMRATMVARPRLGITVALEARETDNIGAYVQGVTPGGPADKAGIRAGDIIRKIGKTNLAERDGVKRPMGESAPGLKLIEAVGRLQPGKAVEIEFRRGSRDRTVKVIPEEADDMIASTLGDRAMVWRRGEGNMIARVPSMVAPKFSADSFRVHVESLRALNDSFRSSYRFMAPTPAVPGRGIGGTMAMTAPGVRSYVFTMGGPLGRFEMTTLNAALGAYFGTNEGVLVINAPEKDNFGLMAGDVITAVDGRKVASPSQLMRIMGTYESNEELKLQIMRQKRAESVSIKLP